MKLDSLLPLGKVDPGLRAPQLRRLSNMRGCQARLHLAGKSGITRTQTEIRGKTHGVYLFGDCHCCGSYSYHSA